MVETKQSVTHVYGDNSTVVCSVFKNVVYVRYCDHVQYSRAFALVMSTQTRETVGWLVYECEQYITLAYDCDTDPPTLKGGDAKASGLVLMRSAILEMKKLDDMVQWLQEPLGAFLNNSQLMHNDEYALSATKVKNSHIKRKNSERKLRCYNHDS